MFIMHDLYIRIWIIFGMEMTTLRVPLSFMPVLRRHRIAMMRRKNAKSRYANWEVVLDMLHECGFGVNL